MEQCEQCGDSVHTTRACPYCGMELCLQCYCEYHPCTAEMIETDIDEENDD